MICIACSLGEHVMCTKGKGDCQCPCGEDELGGGLI